MTRPSIARHVLKPWLAAFLAGVAGALAMAPFDVIPAMIVPMTTSVMLLDRARDLRAAGLFGWWLGFGYFIAGLWWLGAAFLVEPDFAWAMPFGVILLPAFLALFFALAFVLAAIVWRRGPLRIFVLAVSFGIAEALRATLFTGFPWNSLGMALGGTLVSAQIAAFIGLPGLNLVTVSVFAAPACFFDRGSLGRRLFAPLLGVGVIAGVFGIGLWRLSEPDPGTVPDVRFRIMQPDMPQDDRFSRAHSAAILRHYFDLSTKGSYPDRSGLDGITHLVWPETSFPFLLDEDATARAGIARVLEPGTVLLAGAVRAEGQSGTATRRYFNALQVLDTSGRIVATSDKVHLVPFGEYLPFSDLLSAVGLRQFVQAPGGFSVGGQRSAIHVPGLAPGLALICYEAIFSAELSMETVPRPEWLLNVTNDAWFGLTPGPYQHFAQARLRAIEQGLPLIRAANNGISAIVDAHGRIVARLPLGDVGVVDGPLPRPLPATLFSELPGTFGGLPFLGLVLIGFLMTKRQLTPTS